METRDTDTQASLLRAGAQGTVGHGLNGQTGQCVMQIWHGTELRYKAIYVPGDGDIWLREVPILRSTGRHNWYKEDKK